MFPGTWKPLTHGRRCLTRPELKIVACIRAPLLFIFSHSTKTSTHTHTHIHTHAGICADTTSALLCMECNSHSGFTCGFKLEAVSHKRPLNKHPSEETVNTTIFSQDFYMCVTGCSHLPQILDLLFANACLCSVNNFQ